MSETLSPDTQAILLLTAPLIVEGVKREKTVNPLTPREYTTFSQHLKKENGQPAALLTPHADQLIRNYHHIPDKDRLKRLLDRGFLLGQAVDRWQKRSIWVVSRADDDYPQRLRERLKEDWPILLYGCGDKEILNTGGLAVVGSRHANESLVEYTHEIGRLVAKAQRTLISGSARGIDQEAMHAALEADGRVAGVLADNLEKAIMNREQRKLLLEERLILISPYDPNAGFNVGHAMQRNKVIYALADAALVVNADRETGGTWAGATEQLKNPSPVPIYVRSTGEASTGLEALKSRGARPWPNPKDANDLAAIFRSDPSKTPNSPVQPNLPFDEQQEPVKPGLQAGVTPELQIADDPTLRPAEKLYQTIRSLIPQVLVKPKQAAEVATELDVTKPQAKEWLKCLVEEGVLEKLVRPVRYVIRQDYLSRKGNT